MPKVSLKTENALTLASLTMTACAISWISVYGISELESIQDHYEILGGAALASPIAALLANAFPANLKHMLVFSRVKNALPGHRFVELIDRDPRLSLKQVKDYFSSEDLIAKDEKEQNSFWYLKIYRPYQEDLQVKSALRMFLLYRDSCFALFSLAIVTAILYFGSMKLFSFSVEAAIPISLAAQCALLALAARLAGKRMITNAVCALLANK